MFVQELFYPVLCVCRTNLFYQFLIVGNFLPTEPQCKYLFHFSSDMLIILRICPKTVQAEVAVFFLPVFAMLTCP